MRSTILVLCTLLAAPALATEKAAQKPVTAAAEKPATSAAEKPATAANKLEVKVTDSGFEPTELHAKKGEPVTIAFTRVTKDTCIKAVDFPEQGVKNFKLPLNKTVALTLTPKAAGTYPFHCSAMQMGDGKLIVE